MAVLEDNFDEVPGQSVFNCYSIVRKEIVDGFLEIQTKSIITPNDWKRLLKAGWSKVNTNLAKFPIFENENTDPPFFEQDEEWTENYN